MLPPAFSCPSSAGGLSWLAMTPETISSTIVKSLRMFPYLKTGIASPAKIRRVKIHIAMSGRPHGP